MLEVLLGQKVCCFEGCLYILPSPFKEDFGNFANFHCHQWGKAGGGAWAHFYEIQITLSIIILKHLNIFFTRRLSHIDLKLIIRFQ